MFRDSREILGGLFGPAFGHLSVLSRYVLLPVAGCPICNDARCAAACAGRVLAMTSGLKSRRGGGFGAPASRVSVVYPGFPQVGPQFQAQEGAMPVQRAGFRFFRGRSGTNAVSLGGEKDPGG